MSKAKDETSGATPSGDDINDLEAGEMEPEVELPHLDHREVRRLSRQHGVC